MFSCKNEQSNRKITDLNTKDITAIGKTIDTTFFFCGITPVLKEYSYRQGIWIFQTNDGIKFAEGEYDADFKKDVWKRGGCPYSYYENSINLSKWKFWNLNGDKIKPTKNLLSLIEYKAHSEY
jgi:hypothetical protein